jgi:hypothetical protein
MERARDVSKVLEQDAARTREAEQGDDAAKKASQ